MEKTITKTKRFLILFLAFACFAAIAQTNKTEKTNQHETKTELKQWYDSGDIIIDGTVEDWMQITFVNSFGQNEIGLCHKVKINKVLKGNLTAGYINIKTAGHSPTSEPQDPNGIRLEPEYPLEFDGIMTGRRCVVKLKRADIKVECFTAENSGVYTGVGKAHYIVGYQNGKKVYDKEVSFYQTLQKDCNIDLGYPKKESEKKTQISTEPTGIRTNKKSEAQKQQDKFWQSRKSYLQTSNQRTASCKDLYISEYLDGSGSSNAVEIYNPTSSPIHLSNYSLLIYHNATYTPVTIALTGTISPYSTHVVVQQGSSSALLAKANQTTNNLNFNGDVCTVLNKGTIHIDKVGEIGVANAAGNWTLTPTGGTNNADIRRDYNIGKGDTSWSACKAEWQAFSEDSISNIGIHANSCTSIPDPNLYFSLANPQSTGTTPTYFEFDVMVRSNNDSSYLENGAVRIKYSTAAFGTNIYASGKVTVTNAGAFNTSNYGAPAVVDDATNVFGLGSGVNYADTSWSLVHITTVNQQFAHVKIEVSNCYIPAGINLVESDSVTYAAFYDFVQNVTISDPYYLYDNIAYVADSVLNNSTCAPVITGFAAPSVVAGAYYTGIPTNESQLMIQGSGFGSSGTILMKNALAGIHTNSHKYIQLDPSDITFWSSNQITVTVPSIFFNSNPDAGNYVGTGLVKVINASSPTDTAVSPTEIQVPYTLVNTKSATTKYRISFPYRNVIDSTGRADSSAYNIRLDSATITHNTTYPGSRNLIKQAIQDWACALGIHYRIGKDTTITTIPQVQDGISYIRFASGVGADTLSNSNFIAQTTTSYKAGCGASTNVFCSEADINFVLNPSAHGFNNWYFVPSTGTGSGNTPVGQSDFFSVALHEMGHASLELHVNDTTDLMYYKIFPSTGSQPVPRGSISSNDLSGGLDNVVYSKTLTYPTGCTYNPFTIPATTSGSCASPTNGIEKIGANTLQLSVYPNPTTQVLNVTFIKDTQSSNTVKLINITGQVVYYRNIGRNEGANEAINVGGLAKGVYMLIVTDDNNTVTKKIIVE